MKAHNDPYTRRNLKYLHWKDNGPGICRTCGFCGSIHPDDLVTALSATNADIELADMKYGWPHKWYINSPAIMAPGAKKFYSVHLQDATPEALAIIEQAMGLHYEFTNNGNDVSWTRINVN